MSDTILTITDTPSIHTLTVEMPGGPATTFSVEVAKEEISILKVGMDTTDVMSNLVYDPNGKKRDVFDIANLTGVVDCGEFT